MRFRIRLGVRVPIFKNAGVTTFYCSPSNKVKLVNAVESLKLVLDMIPEAKRANASDFIVFEAEEVRG